MELNKLSEKDASLFTADCLERILPRFEDIHPGDDRPRKAIEAIRAFARDEISTGAKSSARRDVNAAAKMVRRTAEAEAKATELPNPRDVVDAIRLIHSREPLDNTALDNAENTLEGIALAREKDTASDAAGAIALALNTSDAHVAALCSALDSAAIVSKADGDYRSTITGVVIDLESDLIRERKWQDWRARWYLLALEGLEALSEEDIRLFAADCAEHVLPHFERNYPDNDGPRKAIEAARAFAYGEISKEDLDVAESGAISAWAESRSESCPVGTGCWSSPARAAMAASLAAAEEVARVPGARHATHDEGLAWNSAATAVESSVSELLHHDSWDREKLSEVARSAYSAEREWQRGRLRDYLNGSHQRERKLLRDFA